MIVIMALALLPPVFQPQDAAAATGTLTVPNEVLAQNQKTYTFTVPATTEIGSVSYSGKGTLTSKSLSGTTLSLTISGVAFTENVTASTNKSGDKLSRGPGNAIWRYADGKRWQINTYNKSTGTEMHYDVTGVNVGDGVPYEYPADYKSMTVTTLSHYTTAFATADDKKWVGDTTGQIYPVSDIDFSNWQMKSAAPDTTSKTTYPTNAVTFQRNSDGYNVYVDHLIHHDNIYDITAQAPSSIGTGGYVQGNNYAAPYIYVLGAKTKTVYQYGGTVTYTSKDDPVDPCKTNPNAPDCEQPAYNVTGDFDILPSSTLSWRDSFSLKPKNFVIPSPCVYKYHEYRIEKNGITWTSDRITSQSTTTSFSYTTYPFNLGIGYNYIQIKVTADCADSGWTAGKNVNFTSPSNNQPPQFNAGFFKEYNRTGFQPDYEVVVGSRLNLRIMQESFKDPPWPYDPDGDGISYTWQFAASSSAWIRSLPAEYGLYEHDEYFYNLLASELGSHSVRVVARDTFGAESSRIVSINVIPENPIPMIEGPTEVKENRPLPRPFDGSKSYSPMGRSIAEYIWENKKDQYTKVGTETIRLDVVDSAGLKSLYPATATLTVLPDDPPVGVLEVPPLGVRGGSFDIMNKSYSPDGDKMASITYRHKYDANHNGFDDDPWIPTVGEAAKTVLKPEKVGKYLFDAYVCEDWGKCAYASDTQAEDSRVIDVVNLAPSVSFKVEGKNEVPDPVNKYIVAASDIVNNWSLYDVNTTTPLTKKPQMWTTDNGKLLAGLGRGMEKQHTFYKSMGYGMGGFEGYALFQLQSDNGYGPNGISPYRALSVRDASRSGPILIPKTNYGQFTTGEDYTDLTVAQLGSNNGKNRIRTNEKYIIFSQTSSEYDYDSESYYSIDYIFALNKNRIPRYHKENVVTTNGCCSFNLKLTHYWDDPNPYDYIMKIPRFAEEQIPYYNYSDVRKSGWKAKADAGDYSGASQKVQNEFMKLVDYEITGSRIYAVYTGSKVKYGYYAEWSDGESYTAWVFENTNIRQLEVRIYDAFTGEYLGSSSEVNPVEYPIGNINFQLSLKGENLVVRTTDASQSYWEFDRSGVLVARGQTPLNPINVTYALRYYAWNGVQTGAEASYTCKFTSPVMLNWKDDKGNSYAY